MKTRKPLARTATVALVALTLGGAASVASAQTAGDSGTGSLTAVVSDSLVGAGRTITSVSDVTLASVSGLNMSGTMTVAVTETAADGVNNWYVTLGSTDLQNAGATATIAASNLSVSNRATIDTGLVGGVSSTDAVGSDSLGTDATLFTVGGETAGSVYTGAFAHTADLDLAVPNGAAIDTYTGTLTVTVFE